MIFDIYDEPHVLSNGNSIIFGGGQYEDLATPNLGCGTHFLSQIRCLS